MKRISSVLVTLLLLFVVGLVASPYWTLYQLKHAYDEKDASTITQHINFVSVQQDINTQLSTTLGQKMRKLTQSPIFQALDIKVDSDRMVNKMVKQAVDHTITPTGVSNLLMGQATIDKNTQLLVGLIAVAMDKIEVTDLITARSQTELTQKIRQQLNAPNLASNSSINQQPKGQYCGINCFNVKGDVHGYPVTLTMQRTGLFYWQIVGIRLPLDNE